MPNDRVRANNPALPVITRRTVLAAPALGLLPGDGFAATESEILRLFHQYQARRKDFNIAYKLDDEAAQDRIYDHMTALEAQVMALPSTCAADFAAKVILDTGEAGMFSDWDSGKLWIEARALTGYGVE